MSFFFFFAFKISFLAIKTNKYSGQTTKKKTKMLG